MQGSTAACAAGGRPAAAFDHPDDDYRGYGAIADGPFAPLYPFYARLVIERTGVRTGHLLDIGSNQGNLGLAAWELGEFSRLSFLDVNAPALERAAELAEQRGIRQQCGFLNCSVEAIELPDESVDLAVSRGSMPFWDDQHAAIREIFRVLRPGGSAYIGGGIGPRSIRQKLQEEMRRVRGEGPFERRRENSKALSDQEYVTLFQELQCSYAIINSCDEGHWLVFSKKEAR